MSHMTFATPRKVPRCASLIPHQNIVGFARRLVGNVHLRKEYSKETSRIVPYRACIVSEQLAEFVLVCLQPQN